MAAAAAVSPPMADMEVDERATGVSQPDPMAGFSVWRDNSDMVVALSVALYDLLEPGVGARDKALAEFYAIHRMREELWEPVDHSLPEHLPDFAKQWLKERYPSGSYEDALEEEPCLSPSDVAGAQEVGGTPEGAAAAAAAAEDPTPSPRRGRSRRRRSRHRSSQGHRDGEGTADVGASSRDEGRLQAAMPAPRPKGTRSSSRVSMPPSQFWDVQAAEAAAAAKAAAVAAGKQAMKGKQSPRPRGKGGTGA
jgi:hypothetical protein